MLPFARARTVLVRCSAEMPVVSPCRTSTETVKAVPSGASLAATIGAQVQAARIIGRHRRADDAAAIADDEGHLLGGAEGCRADEVALVLAVVVVGDDDERPATDRLDRLVHGLLDDHGIVSARQAAQTGVGEQIVGRDGGPRSPARSPRPCRATPRLPSGCRSASRHRASRRYGERNRRAACRSP